MLPPRVDALRLVAEEAPSDPVIYTCGATAREIAHACRRDNHLYVVDSMGLVSSIVLGVSLGLEHQPRRRVFGVEGDGGLLMNLSALATIGYLQPKNLALVILDNEAYASTGGQYTFTTSSKLNLVGVAANCGIRARQVDGLEELKGAIADVYREPGPHLIYMKIAPGNTPAPLLHEDPVALGHNFTRWMKSTL